MFCFPSQLGNFCGLVIKNLPASAEVGLISGPGKAPGEGNGNSLQYSCLGSPMDRGAQWVPWGCRVGYDGVTKQ